MDLSSPTKKLRRDKILDRIVARVGQPLPSWSAGSKAISVVAQPSPRQSPKATLTGPLSVVKLAELPNYIAAPSGASFTAGPSSAAQFALVEALLGQDVFMSLQRELTLPALSNNANDELEATSVQNVPGFVPVDEHSLPLRLFDDEDETCHPPTGSVVLTPYYQAGNWHWLPALVRNFDPARARYTVEFVAVTGDVGNLTTAGREKHVHALDMCADHATPQGKLAFARRLCRAISRREAAKAAVRQQFFVDHMVHNSATGNGAGNTAADESPTRGPVDGTATSSGAGDASLGRIARWALTHRDGWDNRRAGASMRSLHTSLRTRQAAAAAAQEEEASAENKRIVPMGVSRKTASPALKPTVRVPKRRGSVFDSSSKAPGTGATGTSSTSTGGRSTRRGAAAVAHSGAGRTGEFDDSDRDDDAGSPVRGPPGSPGSGSPDTTKPRMSSLSTSQLLQLAHADGRVAELFAEACFEHQFASKAAALTTALRGPGSDDAVAAAATRLRLRVTGARQSKQARAADDELRRRYTLLRLPPPRAPLVVSDLGKVPVPYSSEDAYRAAAAQLSGGLHVRSGTVMRLLHSVARLWQSEWDGVALLDTAAPALPRPCSLSEWRAHQKAHARGLAGRLTGAWHRDVVNVLVDGLPQPEFNLYEQDPALHVGSDLARLLRRVELGMQASLRQLVAATCGQLRQLVGKYLPAADFEPSSTGPAPPAARSPDLIFDIRVELRRHRSGDEGEAATGIAAAAASGGVCYRVHLSPSPAEIEAHLGFPLSTLAPAVRSVSGLQRKVCTMLAPHPHLLAEAPLLTLESGDACARSDDAAIEDTRAWLHGALKGHLLVRAQEVAELLDAHAWIAGESAADVVAHAHAEAVTAAAARYQAQLVAYNAVHAAQRSSSADKGESEPAPALHPTPLTSTTATTATSPPASHAPLRLLPDSPDYGSIAARARAFHDAERFLRTACTDVEETGMFRVHTGELRELLGGRAWELRDALLAHMLACARAEADAAHEGYAGLLDHLQARPRNEAEWLAARDFLASSAGVLAGLSDATSAVHAALEACGEFAFAPPERDVAHAWELKRWPLRLSAAVADGADSLAAERALMTEELEGVKRSFEAQLEALEARVSAYKDSATRGAVSTADSDVPKPAQLAALAGELPRIVSAGCEVDAEIRSAQERGDDINARERCFGLAPTSYAHVKALHDGLDPFLRLWTALSEFLTRREAWEGSQLPELDPAGIERDVTEWHGMAVKMGKSFGDAYPGAAAAARILRSLTEDFRKQLPLIRHVASKALQSRHWEAISESLGREVDPSEDDLTLSHMLAWARESPDVATSLEEVAVKAEKEFALKKTLGALQSEFTKLSLETAPYKATGTFVLRGTDEINQALDDHIVRVQTMLGQPAIRPHAEEAQRYERALLTVQAVLEEWLRLQRSYLYLQPIFSGEDIARQLPAEHRRFQAVEAQYRKVMADARERPKVLETAGRESLLASLAEATRTAETVAKGLEDFTMTKRMAFPRFFFIDQEGLIEILSQTKEPRAVQPHLGKCFEGIQRVSFRGDSDAAAAASGDVPITHIQSAEGELVPLLVPVDPSAPKNRGAVECWLTDLQTSMKLTLKDSIKRAMEAYPTTPRTQWVLQWPGQVVLAVGQLMWTAETEAAIAEGGTEGLRRYEGVLNGQLSDITALVRGKLSPMERATLSALIVIDVHARDVVTGMINKRVTATSEFEWMAQLRYYWAAAAADGSDGGATRVGDDPCDLVARIVNASQRYCYEYLGNCGRLVITPLTDRCYRTLMSATTLLYGGAPAGPAGTGKTETTKDLARALAVQCVVLNCSDQMDVKSTSRLFSGLAQSGAWACLDEFNRIDIEVLSVVAQQVLSIQRAKRARAKTFVFEGTTLTLEPTAQAFITMNPGYAGRSELPDNLKALFRGVAMMVPDYALIAEIRLTSFGFDDARNMARKVTQVLRLCSELLSSQKHYDYGMRALFSILVRAGDLKQRLGSVLSEDVITLQAILDVNLPKFIESDVTLFRGIVRDLFPGVAEPEADYVALTEALVTAFTERGLQPTPAALVYSIQVYETVQVRHGFMLVGDAGCGKSSVLACLATAMDALAARGVPGFQRVVMHTLNPKSVTPAELYGAVDVNTKEWTDGVLPLQYRAAAREGTTSPDYHFLVCDGPVDAVWIESMNTVLDDNKRLCLTSGEIIRMSPQMRMVFETGDLAEASPATVSRVGIVYCEPRRLGWRPLLQSWLQGLPRCLAPHHGTVTGLFEWLLPPLLHVVEGRIRQLTPTDGLSFVAMLLRLLDALLDKPFGRRVVAGKPTNYGQSPVAPQSTAAAASAAEDEAAEAEAARANPDQAKPADAATVVESLTIMAIVWSLGAVTDTSGRAAFSTFLRALLAGRAGGLPDFQDFLAKNPAYSAHTTGTGEGTGSSSSSLPLRSSVCGPPDDDSVYDHTFTVGAGGKAGWVRWLPAGAPPPFRIPDGAAFSTVIVPTVDTVRSDFLLDVLMRHGRHPLAVGDTGTGKTIAIMQKLTGGGASGGLGPGYQALTTAFSARTTAGATQDLVDARLTRRRKGVYGPPPGSRLVLFLDDVNLPRKEKYGAQPVIEVCRQLVDGGGWYDRRDKERPFMAVQDVQLAAAMGLPGGGRSVLTARFTRHFNVLGFVPADDASLGRIFGTLAAWSTASATSAVKAVVPALVTATVSLYRRMEREMLPTPAKAHYTFNLRDLSRVFQGLHMGDCARLPDAPALLRLWGHEAYRTFHDRLTTDEDRDWFTAALSATVKTGFNKEWASVRGAHAMPLYGSLDGGPYAELADREKLSSALMSAVEDHNATAPAPLSLVLQDYAVDHCVRVLRVIRQQGGHALLVGVGGSGRRSLATLATALAGYRLATIELVKGYGHAEWRDDLKRMLGLAGRDGTPTVFLLSDGEIKDDSFLEDVNGILNAGEVPGLFAPDERAAIMGEVQAAVKKEEGLELTGSTETWARFVARVRANLHIVLAFSPIGESFRSRLRTFPALVSSMTLDWFPPWPVDALTAVAANLLQPVELPGERPDVLKAAVLDVCVAMQTSASQLAGRYLAEAKRYTYVTPSSFMELLRSFTGLLASKRTELLGAKARYENGLAKLADTEGQVGGMQAELTALQPKLREAALETEAMIATVSATAADVAAQSDLVATEEAVCSAQAATAGAMKADCEAQLAVALPALENALKAVASLSKNDVGEVRALKKPPTGVMLTCEAVCILFGLQPVKAPNPKGTGPKVDDYWPTAQKELMTSDLLDRLKRYDADAIPAPIIEKITPYVAREDFQVPLIQKASVAAGGLACWVHAIVVYDRTARVVAPKKAALATATAELEAAQTALLAKQAQLQTLRDNLAGLRAQLDAAVARKEKLASDVSDCAARLDRAQRLIGGLGGEKARWSAAASQLGLQYASVVGDVLLAAGTIAYLGAFTGPYREAALSQWAALLRARNIPCAPQPFKLSGLLGDPVTMRKWAIARLPNDALSVDNAIMATGPGAARRAPLFIDPQRQAHRWIRTLEGPSGLKVVRQSSPNFVRVLEAAIQFGHPLLIENCGETLDPLLDPILTRSVVRVGGVSTLKVGDAAVEVDPRFRLYLTTVQPSPHYAPETLSRVNLLNMCLTPEALTDQMLGLAVSRERPDLEEARAKLVVEEADNRATLAALEDRILALLSSASGNILDDEILIATLSESKETSSKVLRAVEVCARTMERIATARAGFVPIASRASQLFFCISDFSAVDPMYQFSLQFFTGLVTAAFARAESHEALERRLEALKATLTTLVYESVCRSLFAKDHLLFSLQLCMSIMVGEGRLNPAELRFMLHGSLAPTPTRPNPCPAWLSDRSWCDVLELATLPPFTGFDRHVEEHGGKFAPLAEAADPLAEVTRLLTEAPRTMPASAGSASRPFYRLMALRCFRQDRMVPAIRSFVAGELGKAFVDPPPFDLEACFADPGCTSTTPIVFVLSPGSDPMAQLSALAEKLGKAKKLVSVSLGQGQGPVAERAIADAAASGGWVCLANCHLSTSWMPRLEQLVEELREPHADFRLWLTSAPSPAFPVSVLQASVKVTVELPRGIRASLVGCLRDLDEGWLAACASRVPQFRRLVYALCFAHAVVSERRKFGPLGWNIPYLFSDSDLRISLDQVKLFTTDASTYPVIPYEALNYLVSEANYGGRVTDDQDRRLLTTIMRDFIGPAVSEDEAGARLVGAATSTAGSSSALAPYRVPADLSTASFLSAARSLPMADGPALFGLHENAEITVALTETAALLSTAAMIQPRAPPAPVSGAGAATGTGTAASSAHAASAATAAATPSPQVASPEVSLSALAADISSKLPPLFDVEAVCVRYPVRYEESLHTVLQQECLRYNTLLGLVCRTLLELRLALKGQVSMTPELEAMGAAMASGRVPEPWRAAAYPSVKPLSGWVTDLVARLAFLRSWIDSGRTPGAFWLPGFFFIAGTLTAVRQNFSRKHGVPIDLLAYEVRVLAPLECEAALAPGAPPPPDGIYVHGLHLVGARWDAKHGVLAESRARELHTPLPVLHLLPRLAADIPSGAHTYSCPLYRTSERAGTLSTTGHSTNHVTQLALPMAEGAHAATYVKAGVAAITMLDM